MPTSDGRQTSVPAEAGRSLRGAGRAAVPARLRATAQVAGGSCREEQQREPPEDEQRDRDRRGPRGVDAGCRERVALRVAWCRSGRWGRRGSSTVVVGGSATGPGPCRSARGHPSGRGPPCAAARRRAPAECPPRRSSSPSRRPGAIGSRRGSSASGRPRRPGRRRTSRRPPSRRTSSPSRSRPAPSRASAAATSASSAAGRRKRRMRTSGTGMDGRGGLSLPAFRGSAIREG